MEDQKLESTILKEIIDSYVSELTMYKFFIIENGLVGDVEKFAAEFENKTVKLNTGIYPE